MPRKFRYYLVTEEGYVSGSDNNDVATSAGRDGMTVVIDTGRGEAVFDGEVLPIEEAPTGQYLTDEVDPDSEIGDDE